MANGITAKKWSWMTNSDTPAVPGSLSAFDQEELATFFETLLKSTLLTRKGSIVIGQVDASLTSGLNGLRIAAYNMYTGNTEASGIRADMRDDFEDVVSPLTAALALVVLHDRPSTFGGSEVSIGALERITISFLRTLDTSLHLHQNISIPHGMQKLINDSWDFISQLDPDITPRKQGEGLIQLQEKFEQLPDDIKRILSLVYFEKTLAPLCKEVVESGLVNDLSDTTRMYFIGHSVMHAQERLHAYHSYGPKEESPVLAIRGLDLGLVS